MSRRTYFVADYTYALKHPIPTRVDLGTSAGSGQQGVVVKRWDQGG